MYNFTSRYPYDQKTAIYTRNDIRYDDSTGNFILIFVFFD